ncbi:MAG: galactose-1-phosphate uridylyltransferase [Candidatus Omnitrophica bacterium]|nr:galactose-1-phosphate uridylyltransferase [Candidatus Omnitrophota bacterium]
MSEMRRDPIVGRWVVIDVDHPKGPGDFYKENNARHRRATCQFCPGKEHFTPPEVDALRPAGGGPNAPGWLARTVPNKFPALTREGEVVKEGLGMFDVMSGVGAHEVVIETPDHDKDLADLNAEEMGFVLKQYVGRSRELARDKRHKYVCIFKNFGPSAGSTVEHAHSQIIALPMVPKTVLEELRGAQSYEQKHRACVFCDVIEREYKDRERIVCENNSFLAFCPYAPRYAFETWIIPKAHSAFFSDLDDAALKDLAAHLLENLVRMRKALSNPSYNFYIHTAPIDYLRPQHYHWHIEIIPKLTRSIGFEWGTGLHIVPTFPHVAAKYLREA